MWCPKQNVSRFCCLGQTKVLSIDARNQGCCVAVLTTVHIIVSGATDRESDKRLSGRRFNSHSGTAVQQP